MVSSPQLIRLPEVMRRVGLRRTAIDKRERAGEFPRRVALGPGLGRGAAVAWRSDEIDAWIASRPRVSAE